MTRESFIEEWITKVDSGYRKFFVDTFEGTRFHIHEVFPEKFMVYQNGVTLFGINTFDFSIDNLIKYITDMSFNKSLVKWIGNHWIDLGNIPNKKVSFILKQTQFSTELHDLTLVNDHNEFLQHELIYSSHVARHIANLYVQHLLNTEDGKLPSISEIYKLHRNRPA